MKKKAKEAIKVLNKYYYDITTDTDKNEFKKGYAYGLKVAIQVIARIFEIEKEVNKNV